MNKKPTPQASGHLIILIARLYADFNRAIMKYIDNGIHDSFSTSS